jgi:hypothetical protein
MIDEMQFTRIGKPEDLAANSPRPVPISATVPPCGRYSRRTIRFGSTAQISKMVGSKLRNWLHQTAPPKGILWNF